jgi:AcrR family transcriptional regulator
LISPTTAPGRRDRDREQRRLALIEAANAVFAEHGFDCATTREIAERAGCAEGLIHRYFNGKRGLLLAILETKAASVVEDFETALPDCPTLEEEAERLYLWHLDFMWERRDFMRVAVSQATIDPTIGRAIGAGINRRRVDLILAKLRRHQQAGRIRPDADLEASAHAVAGLGFAIGFVFQACFGEDRALARRIVLDAARNLCRAIAPAS